MVTVQIILSTKCGSSAGGIHNIPEIIGNYEHTGILTSFTSKAGIRLKHFLPCGIQKSSTHNNAVWRPHYKTAVVLVLRNKSAQNYSFGTKSVKIRPKEEKLFRILMLPNLAN